MIIDCISDLHGHFPVLDGGDLLLIAGDLTAKDTEKEYDDFWRWACYQDYKKIVIIAGNHDNFLVSNPDYFDDSGENIFYLCDSGTEFDGFKIWGSPWTKNFIGQNPRCKAFGLDTEKELSQKWKLIPDDTNILVTHSPVHGCLDSTSEDDIVGSVTLLLWISGHINTIKLHVFGHIHEAYGYYDVTRAQKELDCPLTTIFVNASHVDENYIPSNQPIRMIL